MRFQYHCVVIILCDALTGCMVGPDFHTPVPPLDMPYIKHAKSYKTVSIKSSGKAGKAQEFIFGQDLPPKWWYLFHSKELNYLIFVGLANSPNLAAAKATLEQAQENLNAQIGSTMFPLITAQTLAERERFQGSSLGVSNTRGFVFNLYGVAVNASYTLDIFGGLRRQIEALGAQVDYQQFELEAAYLTLTSNIATTSFTIASLKAQIKATQALIHSQTQQLEIVKKQFVLGGASKADVLTQQNQLAATVATLPPLQQNLAINYHALSVLIGIFPTEEQLPTLDLDKLSLPTHLPVSLPSELVRQRPDIRASEALLHAASAQIGVATANLFPQLNITGSYGYQATLLNKLFRSDSELWNITGTLTQTIFNGGALLAQRRAAIDAYKQAAATYRQTILQAFQNVADTLRALQHDAQELKAQRAAENAAHKSLILTTKQFRLGGVSYLNLLIAQRAYQQAVISRIQAQAARYSDTAGLFQALGGGWWYRTPLACNSVLSRNVSQYDTQCFK